VHPPHLRLLAVTGAAGRIGSDFARHARSRYQLRLSDRPGSDWADLSSYGEIVEADLTDLDRLRRVFEGVDTVVHLAADPSPVATWSQLHETNIVGTYNVFVAAKAAGCRRVVYASSIHAVSGYPADVQVRTNDPVNPGDLYGVTKCFGEALGRYFAEQEGLSVIAIRIGAYQPADAAADPDNTWLADTFVSPRDLAQLIDCCIEAAPRWAIVHGLSDNGVKRLDLDATRASVGYAPVDDFVSLNPRFPDELSQLPAHNVSGGQESGIRDDVRRLGDAG
jgi:nucleoside-diphosphate-sugar epimerase